MRDTTQIHTRILLLDPFLDGLFAPFIVPVIKFWVDQKVDAILFGYAVGAGALLTLVFYQGFDWWQGYAVPINAKSARQGHGRR